MIAGAKQHQIDPRAWLEGGDSLCNEQQTQPTDCTAGAKEWCGGHPEARNKVSAITLARRTTIHCKPVLLSCLALPCKLKVKAVQKFERMHC